MDLIEYNIVGNMKVLLLCCFPSFSELKTGEFLTTRQYTNCQTFSNLKSRPLLKKSSHSFQIELRVTSGEKVTFLYIGITRLVLFFKKTPTFFSNLKDVTRRFLQESRDSRLLNYISTRWVGIPCTCKSYWQHRNLFFA